VDSLALSKMITNDVILPILLRRQVKEDLYWMTLFYTRLAMLGVVTLGVQHAFHAFGIGKRRRVQEDDVKHASLFREPLHPIKIVVIEEIVGGGIDSVEREIAFTPLQIFAGEIQAGGAGASERGTNGETAGIRKSVQYLGGIARR
jgi:hypothetical protein